MPVIVTCRPKWEGGGFAGSEEERRTILRDAQKLGAEYVDVEWQGSFADLMQNAGGRRIVLSHHDFDGVPADLAGAGASHAGDRRRGRQARGDGRTAVRLPRAAADWRSRRASPIALMAMGDAGLPTRVLASGLDPAGPMPATASRPGRSARSG